jgi:hypothetical protein
MEEGEKKAWKSRIEKAADPDRRPIFTHPQRGNTVWAELIDVQRGWDGAPLTGKERQTLFLRFAHNWIEEEIAFNQSVSQPAINKRIRAALSKIATHLDTPEREPRAA